MMDRSTFLVCGNS